MPDPPRSHGSPSLRRHVLLLLLLVGLLLPAGLVAGSAPAVGPGLPHAALRASSPSAPAGPGRTPDFTSPTDGWTTYQGDLARLGDSPDAPPATDHVAWSYVTAGAVTTPLLYSDGLVYAGSWGFDLYAFAATNGTLVWSFATGGVISAPATLAQGQVLVDSRDGNLYDVNATTGGKVWSVPLSETPDAVGPVVVGTTVVAPCRDEGLCGYALSSGQFLWLARTGLPAATPAYDGGALYLPTDNGSSTAGPDLVAVDPQDGALNWTYHLPANEATEATPLAVAGEVYEPVDASETVGYIFALNESSPVATVSHPLYIAPTGFGTSSSAPALAGSDLVIGGTNGEIGAFALGNGARGWTYNASSYAITSSLVDAGGTLLVGVDLGVDGELLELDAASGAVLRHVNTSRPAEATAAPTDDAVFMGADDGSVFAVGATVPSTPQAFRVAAANDSLNVSWQPPADDGGLGLTGYTLSWGLSGSAQRTVSTLPGTEVSAVVPDLVNGASYNVSLAATGPDGTGTAVLATAAPGAVPWPVQNFTLTARDHKVELRWAPPADLEGYSLTGYTVLSGPTRSSLTEVWGVPSGQTSFVEGGLTDGETWFVTLTAQTTFGSSVAAPLQEATPERANGTLAISLQTADPGALSVQVGGAAVPWPADGHLVLSLAPGVYWVNASAPGYQPLDEQVAVSELNTTFLNASMDRPQDLGTLSSTWIYVLGAIFVVAGVLGLLFVLRRRERPAPEAPQEAEPTEEEPELTEEEKAEESEAKEAARRPAPPAEDEDEEAEDAEDETAAEGAEAPADPPRAGRGWFGRGRSPPSGGAPPSAGDGPAPGPAKSG